MLIFKLSGVEEVNMKKYIYKIINSVAVVTGLVLAVTLAPSVHAVTISAPLTADAWQSLNSSTPQTDPESPTYGPPPAAHFMDGPMVFGSGEEAALYAGPNMGRANIESILFVFSARPSDLSSLGTVGFTLDVGGTLVSHSFLAADFLSTSTCDLPVSLAGIGDGEVLGIVFPDTYHAAARVWLDLGSVTDAQIGLVTVTTPVDLRVDIFGVGRYEIPEAPSFASANLRKNNLPPPPTDTETSYLYRIANNAANSGAAGFHQVPDGGATALLLGCALVILGVIQRRVHTKT
jgi:hypothetical protein